MSFQPSSSALTMRQPAHSAVRDSTADHLFTAAALLIAVLIADALLVLAAALNLADLTSLYVTTT